MTTKEKEIMTATRIWAFTLPRHPDEDAISESQRGFFSEQDALLLRARHRLMEVTDALGIALSDRDERLAKAEAENARLDKEVDQLRTQLAGCSVAALGGTSEAQVAKRGDYGWSQSYQDVLDLRLHADAVERKLGEVRAEAGKLLARLAAWDSHEMRIAKVVGYVFEQPSSEPEMTPDPAVVARVERLTREHAGLRERVKELELLGLGAPSLPAPPVVPEGWCVSPVISAEASGWALDCGEALVAMWHPTRTSGKLRIHTLAPLEAVEALLWAIRADKTPPHAGKPPSEPEEPWHLLGEKNSPS